VDLQLLGLDSLTKTGNELQLGATLTLQTLLESEHCPSAMKTALKLEAPLNIRNTATVAGTLVACDGRSTFATTLLALDAKLTIIVNRKSEIVNLGDFLPLRPRGLITSITVPLHAKFAFDYVARTPSDKPLVCVAVAGWGRRPERVEGSGRRRMAVGGYGKSPMLAMDGTATDDVGVAARNAFHEAEDEWASAEYRMDVAATLARRCADSVNNNA
jgi:putative selenate reductase FAD-binding subunit